MKTINILFLISLISVFFNYSLSAQQVLSPDNSISERLIYQDRTSGGSSTLNFKVNRSSQVSIYTKDILINVYKGMFLVLQDATGKTLKEYPFNSGGGLLGNITLSPGTYNLSLSPYGKVLSSVNFSQTHGLEPIDSDGISASAASTIILSTSEMNISIPGSEIIEPIQIFFPGLRVIKELVCNNLIIPSVYKFRILSEVTLAPQIQNPRITMSLDDGCAYLNLYNETLKQYVNTTPVCQSYNDISLPSLVLQPGDAGGYPITSYSDINLDYILQASISDGRIKQPNLWNKLGFGKNGYYEVYLVIDQGKDYHWYRQDKGGNWSHKPGRTPVINVDASGRFISNPVRANHNYGFVNYNNGAKKLWVRRR